MVEERDIGVREGDSSAPTYLPRCNLLICDFRPTCRGVERAKRGRREMEIEGLRENAVSRSHEFLAVSSSRPADSTVLRL